MTQRTQFITHGMTADDCKTTDISKLMPGVFDGLDKSENPQSALPQATPDTEAPDWPAGPTPQEPGFDPRSAGKPYSPTEAVLGEMFAISRIVDKCASN